MFDVMRLKKGYVKSNGSNHRSARLAGKPPCTPQRDCRYRQHHPGQLPIAHFLDYLDHGSTPFPCLIVLTVAPAD